MRIVARLAVVLLLTAGLAACSKDEILQLESQLATVTFKAASIQAELYNVWDVIEDNDDDGLPDPGTEPFLFCETVPFPMGGQRTMISVVSAPWPHSLRVSVLLCSSCDKLFAMVTTSRRLASSDAVAARLTAR